MPKFPFLPLPKFERGDPPRASSFPQHVPIVSKGRQGQRLGPTFNRLARVLEADHRGLSLSEDPSSIAPERALVMEISGSLNNFQAIARGVEGLEFLGEGKMGQPLMFGKREGKEESLGKQTTSGLDSIWRQQSLVRKGRPSMIWVSICQSLQGR